jgi:hypothetical protein
MSSNEQNAVVLTICIFAIVELIISLSIHIYYPCESYTQVLYFIESSGLIGFLGTLFYFALKELRKSSPNIYLLLSNIYAVCMICVTLYWLIGLAIETRHFVDNFNLRQCPAVVVYLLTMTIVGNYLILLLLLICVLCVSYFDAGNKQSLYSHATLIH